MRILLVSLFLVEYAVELANALVEKHQVHLVLSEMRAAEALGDQLQAKLSSRVSLTLLPYRYKCYHSKIWCAFLIFKQYLVFRPHVVHVQECSNPLNLFFYLFHWRPLITTVHDVQLHPGSEECRLTHKKLWVMRILRKYFCGSIIVHGKNLRTLFIDRYGKKAEDVWAVPHGGLFSYIPENRSVFREDPHTVLFFGRMEKYKGLKWLIETEPLISEKITDFKIIVAGQGEELDARKTILQGNPHFEIHDRYIPFSEVAVFFKRAVAVVLPYTEASQSGIVAMAFAFGKPVIATDVGSLSEVVFDGKNGVLVPPRDPLKLSDAICSMLLNPQQKKRLSKGALETANTLLNWNYVAELTTKVYRSKISRKIR
jgi:glycosyltransferase involved in cell wall biosynthesis